MKNYDFRSGAVNYRFGMAGNHPTDQPEPQYGIQAGNTRQFIVGALTVQAALCIT